MPVIAATLFEFSLRETTRQTRRAAGRPDRRLAGLAWLHPIETIRAHLHLAAARGLPAGDATRRVRIERAARRLHRLRQLLPAADQAAGAGPARAWRARRAERRACAALTRAGFAGPGAAAEILRQAQVLTWAPALARLDYATRRRPRRHRQPDHPQPAAAAQPGQNHTQDPERLTRPGAPGQRISPRPARRRPPARHHVERAITYGRRQRPSPSAQTTANRPAPDQRTRTWPRRAPNGRAAAGRTRRPGCRAGRGGGPDRHRRQARRRAAQPGHARRPGPRPGPPRRQ